MNYTLFNNTYEVDTPLCSSAELDAIKAMHQAKEGHNLSMNFRSFFSINWFSEHDNARRFQTLMDMKWKKKNI